MAPFRLTRVVFRAGPTPADHAAEFQPGRVTLLVGPNNSGKSKTLEELAQWASQSNFPPQSWLGGILVESVEVETPGDLPAVVEFLAPRRVAASVPQNHVPIRAFPLLQAHPPGGGQGLVSINLDPSIAGNTHAIRQLVMPHYVISLDGKSRFQLVEPRQLTQLDQPPTSHWMALERDADQLRDVDGMVHDAFGEHLVMTTLNPATVAPALSDEPVPADLLQSTTEAALAMQRKARPLHDFSDGVQVFTGLIAAVSVLPHLLLLIDEPEAFLHRTLARRLGGNLARISRLREANLVAATHSAEFLWAV